MYIWPWHIRHYSDISEEPMYSYGLYSHGPYSYGLHGYGPCSYGRGIFVLTVICQSSEAAVSLRNGNHAPEKPKHVAKNNQLLFQE